MYHAELLSIGSENTRHTTVRVRIASKLTAMATDVKNQISLVCSSSSYVFFLQVEHQTVYYAL